LSVPVLRYDHYYTHQEITDFLQNLADAFPDFASLSSIGKSAEDRDIWCLTITNSKTGCHKEKPAIYVDGNIHAGEVTASHVCLHTALHLLTSYSENSEVRYLLDNRTWYILPRVNPDGAELYLSSPFMLRSVTRENPNWEPKIAGALYPEDLDGDGIVRFMRVKDPHGIWKVSEKDARLLIPRQPGDFGGEYYALLLEGMIHEYEGAPITAAPDRWNLDTNRNFPNGWQPSQGGNGLFPLSEPETLAQVRFVQDHPNLGALQAYHTQGGVILRPSSVRPDRELPRQDVDMLKELRFGALVGVITGFVNITAADPEHVVVDFVFSETGGVQYQHIEV
jgi:murein tripeptide amidase MpaA